MINFSSTKKFTKTNIKRVPNSKAIVYKIKNNTGENLYTGIAGRGRAQDRLQEHKIFKKDAIPGGTKFQFIQVKNKAKATQIEKQIVKKEQPKFNEQNK